MENAFLLRVLGVIFAIFVFLFLLGILIFGFNSLKTKHVKIKHTKVVEHKLRAKPKLKRPSYNNFVIFLDPLHGGVDKGFSWVYKNKLYNESDIVLSFAFKLASRLRALGYTTVISRVGDYYLSQEDRYDLSSKYTNIVYIPIITTYTNEQDRGLCFFSTSWEDSGIDVEKNENAKFNTDISNTKKDVKVLEREEFLLNSIKGFLEQYSILHCSKLFATRHNFTFLSLFSDKITLVLSLGFLNKEEDKVRLLNLDKIADNLAKVLDGAFSAYKQYKDI